MARTGISCVLLGVIGCTGAEPPILEPAAHPPSAFEEVVATPGVGQREPATRGTPPAPDVMFALPPLQQRLEEYQLEIPQEAMDKFAADPFTPEQPATFLFRGRSRPVNVRIRGSSARYFPKKSWRVSFPKGVRFDGRDDLELIAEYQDCTMMVEKLGYDLLRAMGVPASRARYVRLVINGRYEGVFLDLDHVDKHLFEDVGFLDSNPTVYRCGSKDCEMKTWRASYQERWTQRTNKQEGLAPLDELLGAINFTPEPDFEAALRRHFELDRYFRVMAMDARIALNPALRERLSQVIERAIAQLFKPEVMHPRIDAIHALLAPHAAEDPWIDQAKFTYGREFLKKYFTLRNDFVKAELAKYRSRPVGLAFSRFDPQEGWVEVRNFGEAPVSLNGKVLTTNLRRSLTPNLPALTLSPGESVRFTAGELSLSFAEKGELGLFDGESVIGVRDALFYGVLPGGQRYERSAADPKTWEVR
ncbi:MAG: CotH kinase family protein [Myxococcales bacterium]|nr:CotH kinase family protein [Myxococcales bacterium]